MTIEYRWEKLACVSTDRSHIVTILQKHFDSMQHLSNWDSHFFPIVVAAFITILSVFLAWSQSNESVFTHWGRCPVKGDNRKWQRQISRLSCSPATLLKIWACVGGVCKLVCFHILVYIQTLSFPSFLTWIVSINDNPEMGGRVCLFFFILIYFTHVFIFPAPEANTFRPLVWFTIGTSPALIRGWLSDFQDG